MTPISLLLLLGMPQHNIDAFQPRLVSSAPRCVIGVAAGRRKCLPPHTKFVGAWVIKGLDDAVFDGHIQAL